jgi:hypothetical protein
MTAEEDTMSELHCVLAQYERLFIEQGLDIELGISTWHKRTALLTYFGELVLHGTGDLSQVLFSEATYEVSHHITAILFIGIT